MVKVNGKEFVKGNNKGRRKTIIEVKLVSFMLTLIEHIKDNISIKSLLLFLTLILHLQSGFPTRSAFYLF